MKKIYLPKSLEKQIKKNTELETAKKLYGAQPFYGTSTYMTGYENVEYVFINDMIFYDSQENLRLDSENKKNLEELRELREFKASIDKVKELLK